jgi:hypothetical protein
MGICGCWKKTAGYRLLFYIEIQYIYNSLPSVFWVMHERRVILLHSFFSLVNMLSTGAWYCALVEKPDTLLPGLVYVYTSGAP